MASIKLKQDENYKHMGLYLASAVVLKSSSKRTFPRLLTQVKADFDSVLTEVLSLIHNNEYFLFLPLHSVNQQVLGIAPKSIPNLPTSSHLQYNHHGLNQSWPAELSAMIKKCSI